MLEERDARDAASSKREYHGSSLLVKVHLSSGRTITASRAKSFLIYDGRRIVPVNGDSVTVGDMVPIVPFFNEKIEVILS